MTISLQCANVASMETIEASIAHWERLAREQDDWAAYEESRGSSGAAARNRAESYRRAARADELERETGLPHCSCCLKPLKAKGVS